MPEPARKLKRSTVKNIFRFPSTKSGSAKNILVESYLEAKYCLHLEFDPRVTYYYPQPKTFEVDISAEKTRSYTPDFKIQFDTGELCYTEVKPNVIAQNDEYQVLFKRFSEMMAAKNIDFKVVGETEIDVEPILSNYKFLHRYRKRPALNKDKLVTCASEFPKTYSLTTLTELLSGLASTREIYSWLAYGYLKFDVANAKLNANTEVYFDVSHIFK